MNNDEILKHLDLQTDIPECSMSEADIEEQKRILDIMRNPYLPPWMEFDFNSEDDCHYSTYSQCTHEWDGVLIKGVEGNQSKCKHCGQVCFVAIGNPCAKNS